MEVYKRSRSRPRDSCSRLARLAARGYRLLQKLALPLLMLYLMLSSRVGSSLRVTLLGLLNLNQEEEGLDVMMLILISQVVRHIFSLLIGFIG